MKHYKYLIIGGGLTGDAAARGIRDLDPKGSIGMISAEPDPPYSRPSLSKSLWKGKPLERIWRNTQDLDVELHLGHKAVHMDVLKRSIRDEGQNEYTFDRLLLATGGSPRRLPLEDDSVIYFRHLQDYLRLRKLSERGSEFLVIGGGFIGSEIAAALTMAGKRAIMVFPDVAIGAHIFPKELSHFLNDHYRRKGVEVVTNDSVEGIRKDGDRLAVRTRGGRLFRTDGVVAGIGIRPNTGLAQQSGLQVGDGIVVDEHLATSATGVFAAGDVANFWHAGLGKRVRVEHEDNAISMGRLAGHNMAGAHESYTHVPMFYSDLFELGYEAVGELSSRLETVAEWQEPLRKGVVHYLEDGRVRGVLLWNVWDQVEDARALLTEADPLKVADLEGRFS